MLTLLEFGAFRLMCKYVTQKKNSAVWYYRRRIPSDVAKLHINKSTRKADSQIFVSLKTTDKALACKRADEKTRQLDALWASHRGNPRDIVDPAISLARIKAAGLNAGDGKTAIDDQGLSLPPIDDFVEALIGIRDTHDDAPPISAQDKLTIDILYGAPVPKTLKDAQELYLTLGKGPKNKVGRGQFDRAWNLLFDVAGNKVLADVRRADANEYVSHLIKRGVSAETIRKYISQISPAIKLAIKEFELSDTNQFEGVVIANKGEESSRKRIPYTDAELKAIKAKCHEVNDPRRWLLLALADTGARLSELLGMEKADVFLDAPIPYIHIHPNSTRRVKTEGSNRTVPLVGDALWAFQTAMKQSSPYVFPSLLPDTLGIDFSSGNVSSSLGKWLKTNKLARKGQVIHSLRHTIADRLRNAGISKELMDAIGGWQTDGMSSRYGEGYSLESKRDALLKIIS